MTQRKPIVIVDGRQQQIQSGDTLGGISSATSTGEAMVYDQFGANASHMTPTGDPTFDAITGTSDATINGMAFGHGPGGDSASLVAGGGNAITTATSVTAIGPGALGSLTTGNWNTAAGQGALATLVGGQSNVAIGNSAGHKQADDITNITGANSSIYIGSSVRGFGNNDSYAIVIGAHAAGEAQSGIVIGSSNNTVSHLFGTPTFGNSTTAFTLDNAGLTAARTVTLPDASGTMTLLGNTSTGSGSVVLATSPSLTTPNIGAATATTVNGVSITGSGTLATGSGNTLTLTGNSTINQNVTTTGTPQFAKTGIGTAPTRFLDIVGTTEQARIAYNSTNYMSTTVDASANTTFNLTASSGTPKFIFNDPWQSLYGAFGTSPLSYIGLRVSTAFTGSTTTRGVFIDGVTDSGATTAHYCFQGQVRTENSVFTCATASVFQAASSSKGASSTITNLLGFDCADQTDGTNNIGYRSQVSSGANKWNFYASGTALNYLNGGLQIGHTGTALGKLESRATAGAQITASYDGSNYATMTVASNGATTFDAAGAGAAFTFSDNVSSTGSITSTGTGGVGYTTGAGGTVTQATSRTTGVTLNKTTGAITLVSAAGSASWQTFTVTNSTVAATDVVIVNQKSGTDLYMTHVTNVAAGSFKITFATTGGTTVEQPVFSFAVIKGATA